MNEQLRETFDACFARVLDALPERITRLFEEQLVVIVDDQPTPEMLADLASESEDPDDAPDGESLLGLHTGVPMTEWSIEDHGRAPTTVHLFRRGILAEASSGGGLDVPELERQIRITLLHEIGHHYGLEEDDLEGLGYG